MSGGKKIYSWLQRWLDEDYHSKVVGNSKTARIMQTTNSESGMPYFMFGSLSRQVSIRVGVGTK